MTTAGTAVDRRTVGTMVEDEGIELRATNRVSERFGDKVHVNAVPGGAIVSATGGTQRKEGKLMPYTGPIFERNQELARQINEEALKNPNSPYANKFVGIANGQVVVVADTAEEMSQRLRQIEPDPSKCFGVEASRDHSKVVEIWGLR